MEIKLERDKRYFNEISGLAVFEFSVKDDCLLHNESFKMEASD